MHFGFTDLYIWTLFTGFKFQKGFRLQERVSDSSALVVAVILKIIFVIITIPFLLLISSGDSVLYGT